MRTVRLTRYVTPLREGGSLPAIVEADDDGLYVLKFRGAGQGARALIAELVSGEIARAIGLPVPEIVFADVNPDLARTEPDPEIHALILDSAGLNLALDYLPGSVMFDPSVDRPAADLASRIVWFDAFISNVDRTARNTNMLMWHRRLWLIDHGASLYFHHAPGWHAETARAKDPFALIRTHVLLRAATDLERVDEELTAALTADVLSQIVELIPETWLDDPRDAYRAYLGDRLQRPRAFVEEAARARCECVYDYAIVRIVPRVERGEMINVGIIVSCPDSEFIAARIELDEARLLALDPALDVTTIRAHLATIPAICEGKPDAGPIAALPARQRFYWLVSPRSTVIQVSPVHTGRAADPTAALERLMESMVRVRRDDTVSPPPRPRPAP